MQERFQKLLHDYKVEQYQDGHRKAEDYAAECMHIAEDVLNQKYRYHFHKLPDADRAEIINMINNYTREAILPPVVEKLVERQLATDRRVKNLEMLLVKVLEEIGQEAPAAARAS